MSRTASLASDGPSCRGIFAILASINVEASLAFCKSRYYCNNCEKMKSGLLLLPPPPPKRGHNNKQRLSGFSRVCRLDVWNGRGCCVFLFARLANFTKYLIFTRPRRLVTLSSLISQKKQVSFRIYIIIAKILRKETPVSPIFYQPPGCRLQTYLVGLCVSVQLFAHYSILQSLPNPPKLSYVYV